MSVDLTLIWAAIIAFAVFMYVLMDGFDLGVGILFPWAPQDRDRDLMMNSVAPVWDGNETWLVLGGGGLLAAFPLAYAIILPALYIPLLVMLIARGPQEHADEPGGGTPAPSSMAAAPEILAEAARRVPVSSEHPM